MAAPVKLDPKAVIKGKVFIAGDNLASFSDDDKMMYGFADYRKAMSLDEIGTLIQVTCTKGRPLGLYVDKYDKKIKGFASECKVSILDYQAPAVIAQKSFSNAKAPQVIKSIEADLNDEYLMPRPLGDMCSYINSFQVDKEIPTPNILSEKELLRVPVKVELNPSAAIKGKTMVVQRDDRGEIGPFNYMLTTFSSNGTAYGFAGDKLTYQPTELETIIKIDCAKGGPIGKVQNTSEFSSKCEVSLIDYKTLTVFAQKTFENKTLDQEVRKESYPLDWAIDIPKQEIESYLKSFPVS